MIINVGENYLVTTFTSYSTFIHIQKNMNNVKTKRELPVS